MVDKQSLSISMHLICFILNIPALAWHITSKNIPAITLLIYLEIMMLNGFVGSIVWGGTKYLTGWDGKGWCDLMIRIQIASSVGISSCIACISFNLMMIFLTNRATTFWFNNKWAKPTFEVFASIIFPFIISGVSYFAQGFRYIITQNYGCTIGFVDEYISILVFFVWIFVWCFFATAISVSTLFLYFKKRKEAKEILVCTNSGLSVKKFIRLLVYCMLVISADIVFSCLIGSSITVTDHTFYDNNSIDNVIRKIIVRESNSKSSSTDKWVLISISLISFFIFGIGKDANKMYKSILLKLPLGALLIEYISKGSKSLRKVFKKTSVSDRNIYALAFWNSDEEANDSTEEDHKETTGSSRRHRLVLHDKLDQYSPSDGCITAYSEDDLYSKMFFNKEDTSPTTLQNEYPMHRQWQSSIASDVRDYIRDAEESTTHSIENHVYDNSVDPELAIDDELRYLYY